MDSQSPNPSDINAVSKTAAPISLVRPMTSPVNGATTIAISDGVSYSFKEKVTSPCSPMQLSDASSGDKEGDKAGFQLAKGRHFKKKGFAKFNRWIFRSICTYLIIAALVVICISLTCVIICSKSSESRKNASKEDNIVNTPIITSTTDALLLNKHLILIPRVEWLARPSEAVDVLVTPVKCVIIMHTATNICKDKTSCTFQVRTLQTYYIESKHLSDIAYNFLVGGDGAIYEGRGWDNVGAHTKGHDADCIGIVLIGTFNIIKPPERQLIATLNIISKGVELGKIAKDYKIFGHRQLIATLSPGDALFNIIKTWSHFSEKL